MFTLDSSAIIELTYETEMAKKIVNFIQNKEITATTFSIYEVFYSINEKERSRIENILFHMQFLEYDRKAATESIIIRKNLESKGKMIGVIDIFIAAICKSSNTTLITLNKDFEKIEGLKVKTF